MTKLIVGGTDPIAVIQRALFAFQLVPFVHVDVDRPTMMINGCLRLRYGGENARPLSGPSKAKGRRIAPTALASHDRSINLSGVDDIGFMPTIACHTCDHAEAD